MFVEGKPRTVFFLQTLYFTAFIATVEKIITYALGEHDPGSAQNWRTSSVALFLLWIKKHEWWKIRHKMHFF